MKTPNFLHRFTFPILILSSLFYIQGCGCADDCLGNDSFSFSLIDAQTGKDIVFDLGVPIGEIVLKDARNETMDIYKEAGVLRASSFTSNNKLIYQNKEYSFDLIIERKEKKCCDLHYVTGMTSEDAEISVKDSIFIMKI